MSNLFGPFAPQRVALLLEFDGTDLVGWQKQNNGPSIQEHLERAACGLFRADRVPSTTSGRTDAGVHACAMTVHLDVPFDKTVSQKALRDGLNYYLKPAACSVLDARPVPLAWHARFSASWRRYCYVILNRPARSGLYHAHSWHCPKPLEIDRLNEMARLLLGAHDFTSFRASACQANSPMRDLDFFEFRRFGDFVVALIRARSFLHHQVRNMVGTLVQTSNRNLPVTHISDVLEAKDRSAGGMTAPAQGLYFIETGYRNKIFDAPSRLPFGFEDFDLEAQNLYI